MTVSVPTRSRPGVPDVFHGEIYQNIGKYARGAILYAFEQVGGPEALTDWAARNPDDFYTKLFPKIVTRETEVHHVKTMDDLMDILDGDFEIVEQVSPHDSTTDMPDLPQNLSLIRGGSGMSTHDYEGFDLVEIIE